MQQLASALDVEVRRVTRETDPRIPPGVEYRLTDYFGTSGAVKAGPQSFLAETDGEKAVISPHFHKVDQFQIFWTRVKFGKRLAEPVFVHYTDAFTIYGPIMAIDDGLSYLTVRSKSDPGPRFMPGSRAERKRRPAGRHLKFSVGMRAVDPCAPEVETLAGPYDDGLGVHVVTLPPGGSLPSLQPASAGIHFLVLDGSLSYEGREHPPLSIFFVDNEPPEGAVSGPLGLAALVLQFPVREP